MDKCGRKTALICSQVPMVIGWFYTWRATAPKDIIVGKKKYTATLFSTRDGLSSTCKHNVVKQFSRQNYSRDRLWNGYQRATTLHH